MAENTCGMDTGERTGPPLLELTDAVVRRDGRVILSVDSFVLEEGEHVAIIGPNGAGKSTLVKLLTREVLPLWREKPPVLFLGEPRPVLSDVRSLLGVVSMSMQEQIEVDLTVREVVLGGFFGSLGVPARRTVTEEMESIVVSVLVELGIDHLAQRDVRTLSTGEARRALICRALVHDPRVLVFDEPCVGLDPEAAYQVRQSFSAMARAGRTLLLVTHHIEDVVPEFERVLAIDDGRIVADGPKNEVLTTELIQTLFKVPLVLEERDGSYRLW